MSSAYGDSRTTSASTSPEVHPDRSGRNLGCAATRRRRQELEEALLERRWDDGRVNLEELIEIGDWDGPATNQGVVTILGAVSRPDGDGGVVAVERFFGTGPRTT